MQYIEKITVGCPGCSSPNHLAVQTPMPTLLNPSIIRFNCELCDSEVLAKLTKPKGFEAQPKGSVKILARITKPSETLARILKEEREERESVVKDQVL